MSCVLSLLSFIAVTDALRPGTVAAQLAEAARTITAQDIARHVGVIAHDSMLGRDTPSRGLDLTAQYVADQFQKLGLKPGVGVEGLRNWFMRYPIPIRYDFARSHMLFTAGDKSAAAGFGTAARMIEQALPRSTGNASVLLLTGRFANKQLGDVPKKDKIVLYIPPVGGDGKLPAEVIRSLRGQYGSHGIVTLSGEDSATFHAGLQGYSPVLLYPPTQPDELTSSFWQVDVRSEAVAGLRDVLTAAGLDLAKLRVDSTPTIRDLSSLKVSLDAKFTGTLGDTATAPNVLGLLEGTDPKLKRELIVVTAHMDHVGLSRGRPDSINNGADDNASGVAGLLELAEAFSQPGARPRRPIMFIAVSGGAKPGFWGSTIYASHLAEIVNDVLLADLGLPRPIFNINLDMIGQGARDAVTVYGFTNLESGVRPDWIAGAHPELRLTVADGGTVFSPRSDHFAFASSRLLLPSVSFQTGNHEDDLRGAELVTINADLAARIVRLVFYVGQEIANADKIPRWTSEARRQRMQGKP